MSALGAGAGDERTAYLYLGHGNEEAVPYEERKVVPEGSIVVSFTKPGEGIEFVVSDKIIRVMHENPALFQNPVANKDEIERLTGETIRIYEAGSLMPALHYFPLNDGPGRIVGQSNVYRSGVYQLPFEFDTLYELPILRAPVTRDILRSVFKGSTNEFVLQTLLRTQEENVITRFYDIDKLREFQFPAYEILREVGSGVHYFLNCRGVRGLRKKLQTFVQDINGDIDNRKLEVDSYIPMNIHGLYRKVFEKIHTYIFDEFKDSLNNLHLDIPPRTTANLPENKLQPLYNLLAYDPETPIVENPYKNKDMHTICNTMISTICDIVDKQKLQGIPEAMEGIQEMIAGLFQPPAIPDKKRMADLLLGPIKQKYVELFNMEFRPLRERLTVTRQMSSEGQARYVARGGRKTKKMKKQKRKSRKA
jgi:hypothetical protein